MLRLVSASNISACRYEPADMAGSVEDRRLCWSSGYQESVGDSPESSAPVDDSSVDRSIQGMRFYSEKPIDELEIGDEAVRSMRRGRRREAAAVDLEPGEVQV